MNLGADVTTATAMSALVTDIYSWPFALMRWLFKPWRVWVTAGVLPAVIAMSLLLPGTIDVEDRVRYCGLTLQILTIAILAFLLHDKRLTFEHKGLHEQFHSWLAHRPPFRPRGRRLSLGTAMAISSSFGGVTLSQWRITVATASIEEGLAALEANLNTLKRDFESAVHRLQDSVVKLDTELTEERQARETTDSTIRGKIDRFAAGNLNLEFLNLVLLIFGTIFATIPNELVEVFKWIA